MIRLKIPSQFSQRIKSSGKKSSNQFMVVYVNNQASEKLLKNKIHQWHNAPYTPGLNRLIKCQLERDSLDLDWDNDNNLSETSDLSRTSSMSSNHEQRNTTVQSNGTQYKSNSASTTWKPMTKKPMREN